MIVEQLDLGPLVPPPGGSIADAPLLEPAVLARCSGHKVVFDCETDGLYWWQHRVIGVAIWCPDADVCGYIPTHVYPERVGQIVRLMTAWSPETVVINHNIKFDFHHLGIDPLAMPWRYYDTMVMAHLYDSRGVPREDGSWDQPGEERGSLALGRLALYYLRDSAKLDYLALMQRQKRGKHHEWPLRIISRYAVDDARLTYELAHFLGPRLRQRGQTELLNTAMRYLGILWRTERRGLLLDTGYLLHVRGHIADQLKAREQELFSIPELGGKPFKWRHPQTLSHKLYDDYGWRRPLLSEAKRGQKITISATSSKTLLHVAQHPLAPLIVQMRGLDKLRGYIDSWTDLADTDGRLHPSFNQTFVLTARLSSRDPNTQQIPGDERSVVALGAFEDTAALEAFYAATNMRRAFVPTPGHTFVACDYAQQEVRMFARLSGDQRLLEAATGRDVHAQMALRIWGQAGNPYRDWAKTMTLGMLYGMGLELLYVTIGDDADRIYADYHQEFPGIKRFQRAVAKQIERAGFVTYWSGRRYYRSDERAFHKAANALVQGGSADLLMHAVVSLHDWIERERLPVHIVNYVHDEVDFEIADDAVAELAPEIGRRMQMEHLLDIPFLTDMKVGRTLGSLTKLT